MMSQGAPDTSPSRLRIDLTPITMSTADGNPASGFEFNRSIKERPSKEGTLVANQNNKMFPFFISIL